MSVAMKTCSNPECAQTLPLNQFHKDCASKDGHKSRCKSCMREYKHTHYQAHREELRETHAAYRVGHREEIRQSRAAYYQAHRDAALQYSAAYRQAHREAWCQSSIAYYRAHLEEARQQHRAYRQAHPEVRALNQSTRRARKRGARINDFTAAQWRAMKEWYQHRCAYCGKKCQRLTQDHVIPLAKGGNHSWDNIVPACQSCNSTKGMKAPLKPVQMLLNIV